MSRKRQNYLSPCGSKSELSRGDSEETFSKTLTPIINFLASCSLPISIITCCHKIHTPNIENDARRSQNAAWSHGQLCNTSMHLSLTCSASSKSFNHVFPRTVLWIALWYRGRRPCTPSPCRPEEVQLAAPKSIPKTFHCSDASH